MLALAAYLKGSKAMRIARIGNTGQEKPAVVQGDHYILVDSLISDWSRQSLEDGALEKVKAADLSALPRVAKGSTLIGSPINRPTKVICVGLNYLGHIKDTNADTPA